METNSATFKDAFEALTRHILNGIKNKEVISFPDKIFDTFHGANSFLLNDCKISRKLVQALEAKGEQNGFRLAPLTIINLFTILLGMPHSRNQEKLLYNLINLVDVYKDTVNAVAILSRITACAVTEDSIKSRREHICTKLASAALSRATQSHSCIWSQRIATYFSTMLLRNELLTGHVARGSALFIKEDAMCHKLGDILYKSKDYILRLLVADLMRELLGHGAPSHLFWPQESDLVDKTKIPSSAQATSSWISETIEIFSKIDSERAFDQDIQRIFRLKSLDFGDGLYEDVTGSIILVVTQSIDIVLPAETESHLQLIEVCASSVKVAILTQSDDSDQHHQDGLLRITFPNGDGDRWFRGIKKAVETLQLGCFYDKDSSVLSRILEGLALTGSHIKDDPAGQVIDKNENKKHSVVVMDLPLCSEDEYTIEYEQISMQNAKSSEQGDTDCTENLLVNSDLPTSRRTCGDSKHSASVRSTSPGASISKLASQTINHGGTRLTQRLQAVQGSTTAGPTPYQETPHVSDASDITGCDEDHSASPGVRASQNLDLRTSMQVAVLDSIVENIDDGSENPEPDSPLQKRISPKVVRNGRNLVKTVADEVAACKSTSQTRDTTENRNTKLKAKRIQVTNPQGQPQNRAITEWDMSSEMSGKSRQKLVMPMLAGVKNTKSKLTKAKSGSRITKAKQTHQGDKMKKVKGNARNKHDVNSEASKTIASTRSRRVSVNPEPTYAEANSDQDDDSGQPSPGESQMVPYPTREEDSYSRQPVTTNATENPFTTPAAQRITFGTKGSHRVGDNTSNAIQISSTSVPQSDSEQEKIRYRPCDKSDHSVVSPPEIRRKQSHQAALHSQLGQKSCRDEASDDEIVRDSYPQDRTLTYVSTTKADASFGNLLNSMMSVSNKLPKPNEPSKTRQSTFAYDNMPVTPFGDKIHFVDSVNSNKNSNSTKLKKRDYSRHAHASKAVNIVDISASPTFKGRREDLHVSLDEEAIMESGPSEDQQQYSATTSNLKTTEELSPHIDQAKQSLLVAHDQRDEIRNDDEPGNGDSPLDQLYEPLLDVANTRAIQPTSNQDPKDQVSDSPTTSSSTRSQEKAAEELYPKVRLLSAQSDLLPISRQHSKKENALATSNAPLSARSTDVIPQEDSSLFETRSFVEGGHLPPETPTKQVLDGIAVFRVINRDEARIDLTHPTKRLDSQEACTKQALSSERFSRKQALIHFSGNGPANQGITSVPLPLQQVSKFDTNKLLFLPRPGESEPEPLTKIFQTLVKPSGPEKMEVSTWNTANTDVNQYANMDASIQPCSETDISPVEVIREVEVPRGRINLSRVPASVNSTECVRKAKNQDFLPTLERITTTTNTELNDTNNPSVNSDTNPIEPQVTSERHQHYPLQPETRRNLQHDTSDLFLQDTTGTLTGASEGRKRIETGQTFIGSSLLCDTTDGSDRTANLKQSPMDNHQHASDNRTAMGTVAKAVPPLRYRDPAFTTVKENTITEINSSLQPKTKARSSSQIPSNKMPPPKKRHLSLLAPPVENGDSAEKSQAQPTSNPVVSRLKKPCRVAVGATKDTISEQATVPCSTPDGLHAYLNTMSSRLAGDTNDGIRTIRRNEKKVDFLLHEDAERTLIGDMSDNWESSIDVDEHKLINPSPSRDSSIEDENTPVSDQREAQRYRSANLHQQSLYNSIIQVADAVILRVEQEEVGIAESISTYRSGGKAMIETFTSNFEKRFQHESTRISNYLQTKESVFCNLSNGIRDDTASCIDNKSMAQTTTRRTQTLLTDLAALVI